MLRPDHFQLHGKTEKRLRRIPSNHSRQEAAVLLGPPKPGEGRGAGHQATRHSSRSPCGCPQKVTCTRPAPETGAPWPCCLGKLSRDLFPNRRRMDWKTGRLGGRQLAGCSEIEGDLASQRLPLDHAHTPRRRHTYSRTGRRAISSDFSVPFYP